MKKIFKKLIKSFLLKKLYEYKNRRRYGSEYDIRDRHDSDYEDSYYSKPKYLKRKKKKKKDFKYMLKKMFD